MPLGLRQTIAPTAEPVSLAQAKAHLRVDIPDDDDFITGLISAAREIAEIHTKRQIMPATWRLTLDYFPSRYRNYGESQLREKAWENGRYFQDRWICLPRPRLQSVASITYVDLNGQTQTLDPSLYQVDLENEPGRIGPIYNGFWPDTQQVMNAVQVVYTAGYAATTATLQAQLDAVPKSLTAAMKLMMGHWNENRETVSLLDLKEVPLAATSLLISNSVPWIF